MNKRWTRGNKVCENSGDEDAEVPVDHKLSISLSAALLNTDLAVEYGSGLVQVNTTNQCCLGSIEWAENT